MKIYTIYTESHREMYTDYFLKTLPNEFEVIPTEIPQECTTGEFYSEGWDKTCYKKTELYLRACEENMGEIFAFSDVDIQFFGKIKDVLLEELGDFDIACQNDTGPYYCSGFFVCRGNERTLNMFREMVKNYEKEDQTTLNNHIHMVKSKFLSYKFFTIGHLLHTAWTGEEFEIQHEILMHHSNWVVGIENKSKLMDIVREKIDTRISNIQGQIDQHFSSWRPAPEYDTYPPYHEGLYLEDRFYELYKERNIISNRFYIPVFWTTCYCENKIQGLQEAINRLNPNMKYFTVAQHDDAVREKLPKDTICFNAGGNGGGIPIPLICSSIKESRKPKVENRDIFCSFIGSLTHPIRIDMYNVLKNDPKYYLRVGQWTSSVSDDNFQNFLDVTSRSTFALCPRGYGRSSFRLYEVMQLGTIPVFIYDDKWVPFEDEIDWNEFSVLIHSKYLNKIDEILSSYSEDRIEKMRNNLYKYWKENFTMEMVFDKIINRI
jgi:hypothetical protein